MNKIERSYEEQIKAEKVRLEGQKDTLTRFFTYLDTRHTKQGKSLGKYARAWYKDFQNGVQDESSDRIPTQVSGDNRIHLDAAVEQAVAKAEKIARKRARLAEQSKMAAVEEARARRQREQEEEQMRKLKETVDMKIMAQLAEMQQAMRGAGSR